MPDEHDRDDDDREQEQAVEIKWATEPARSKTPPDVEVRRESYFRALKTTAKKKKLALKDRLKSLEDKIIPDIIA